MLGLSLLASGLELLLLLGELLSLSLEFEILLPRILWVEAFRLLDLLDGRIDLSCRRVDLRDLFIAVLHGSLALLDAGLKLLLLLRCRRDGLIVGSLCRVIVTLALLILGMLRVVLRPPLS